MGCYALLQGIFPTQGSNPGPLHWEHGVLTTGPPGKSQTSLSFCKKPNRAVHAHYKLHLKGDHAYQPFVLNISASLLQIAVDSVLPEPTITPFSLRSLLQDSEDSSELDKIQRAPFPAPNHLVAIPHARFPHSDASLRCCAKSLQSCMNLCNPIYHRPPNSSVHGILQARILEWVAMPSCRASSRRRAEPSSPALTGRFFTTEPQGKPQVQVYQ